MLNRNATNGLPAAVTLGALSTTRSYNEFGEELTRASTYGSQPLYSTSGVVRDNLGRIVHEVRTILGGVEERAYTYNGRGQLETATIDGTETRYAYDANGNRLTRSRGTAVEEGHYDGADRVEGYGDYTYAFDALGALASKTHISSASQTRYSYDAFGALRSVELPDERLASRAGPGYSAAIASSVLCRGAAGTA